jgi:para-aminobenzoate synthetase component 1
MPNAPTPFVLPIPYRDPLAAFAPFCDEPMSMLLHGAGDHPQARWSYVLTNPASVVEIPDASALDNVRRQLGPRRPCARPAPFGGGAVGFLSYEVEGPLGMATRQPAQCTLRPIFGVYDCVAAFDNVQQRAWIIQSGETGVRNDKADALFARLGWTLPAQADGIGSAGAIDSAATYREQVAFLVERIRAGDLLQCNISRRFAGRLHDTDDPFSLFCRLSEKSPAPFAAYIRTADAAIVSNSPERLVALTPAAERLIAVTSPIKGTRPRGDTPADDERLARELQDDEKERAENLMIVDLMRNDLSRVCIPGSVEALRLFAMESFTNVHHLVSTIQGVLKPGLDACDLLQAVFPAGSITGAPKIKAMEMIREIELGGRCANYGAIIWLGFDGAMDSSVLIRTATCTKHEGAWRVEFRAGGGITAESDPLEEAMETEAKAANLIAAIRNTGA